MFINSPPKHLKWAEFLVNFDSCRNAEFQVKLVETGILPSTTISNISLSTKKKSPSQESSFYCQLLTLIQHIQEQFWIKIWIFNINAFFWKKESFFLKEETIFLKGEKLDQVD